MLCPSLDIGIYVFIIYEEREGNFSEFHLVIVLAVSFF